MAKRAPAEAKLSKILQIYFSRHTACAAIPSPRPVKPRPSSVVALMLTQSRSRLQADAMLRRISSMYGRSWTLCKIVASIFQSQSPVRRTAPPPLRAALSCPHRRTAGHRPGKARRCRASPRRAKHPLWHAASTSHRNALKDPLSYGICAAQNELFIFYKLVYVITVTDPHSNTPLLFRRKSLCHKQIFRAL